MPKRPNPSDKVDKDEGKKARTGSAPEEIDGLLSRISAVAANVSRIVYRPTSEVHPPAATDKPTEARTSSSGKSSSNKINGSNGSHSGGNAFLKSVRATNGDAKKPKPTPTAASNGKDAKLNGDSKPSAKEPRVPFPHLPLENESKPTRWRFLPYLVFLSFLLNMAAVIYIASLQSWQNMIQLKNDLELESLSNELHKSHDEVDILRKRMKVLEEAREAGEKMLKEETEVYTGLFGSMVGGGHGSLLTSEERNEWLEKLRLLEANRQSAMDEFSKNLSEVGEHKS